MPLTEVMVKELLMRGGDHSLLDLWMSYQDTGKPTSDLCRFDSKEQGEENASPNNSWLKKYSL